MVYMNQFLLHRRRPWNTYPPWDPVLWQRSKDPRRPGYPKFTEDPEVNCEMFLEWYDEHNGNNDPAYYDDPAIITIEGPTHEDDAREARKKYFEKN